MFLCPDCLKKMGLEDVFWLMRSRGPCEDCRQVAICIDYPTKLMPPRKPPEEPK